MSKRDLRRVIDERPVVRVTAGGVVVMPSFTGNWLAADGSVPLSGDLEVLAGVTVDGVDISELAVSVQQLVGANTTPRTGYTVEGHGTNLADPAPDWIGTIKVWDDIFTVDELVALSDTSGQIEYMRISSAAVASTNYGGLDCYEYEVTRRIETDPAGISVAFPAGTLVSGLTDHGFIAIDNRYGRDGSPSLQVTVFTDSPATLDAAERIVQIGNLQGALGLDEEHFGAAFGRLTTGDRYLLYNAADNYLALHNSDLAVVNGAGETVFWVAGAGDGPGQAAAGYTVIGRLASRITISPDENRVSIWVNEREVIWFDATDGSRIAGLLSVGSPTGPQIQLGELDGEAVILGRNTADKVQFLVRTSATDDAIHFHLGNPKPEPGWLDYHDGTVTLDGVIRARGGEFLGRLTFGSTGEIIVLDPDDSRRYGWIVPHGIVGYTVDALDVQHVSAVDAWAPLTVTYAPGLSRTWLAGEGFRGDWRYRHFRWERGANGRVGLFNGETGVAYLTASGSFYGAGELHAANDRVVIGEASTGVRITRFDLTSEIITDASDGLDASTAEGPADSLLRYTDAGQNMIWGLDAWTDTVSVGGKDYLRDAAQLKSMTRTGHLAYLKLATAAGLQGQIRLQASGGYDAPGSEQSATIDLYAYRTTTGLWNYSRIDLLAGALKLQQTTTEPDQDPGTAGAQSPDGLLAWADGAGWNPGSGQGLYWKQDGVWQLFAASSRRVKGRTVTDTTTETTGDEMIVCNKGSAMTVNLLAATGSWRELKISNVGTGAVTVDGYSTNTINGETTQTVNQRESITLVDYASGAWVIV